MRVFVSYSREDLEVAKRLVEALKAREIRCWFDQQSNRPGENWRIETEEAIRKCQFFVALLSNRALKKRGFVHRELKLALDIAAELPPRTQFIIPVRLEDCDPSYPALKDSQWVDLFPSYKRGVDQLARLFSSASPRSLRGRSPASPKGGARASSGSAALTGKVASRVSRSRVYEGPEIKGMWCARIKFPDGEENWHHLNLTRNGKKVTGESDCYRGYSKGSLYKLAGSIDNLILTVTYSVVDPTRIERGAMALMLVNDAKTMKGHLIYYDSESNAMKSTNCEWHRTK